MSQRPISFDTHVRGIGAVLEDMGFISNGQPRPFEDGFYDHMIRSMYDNRGAYKDKEEFDQYVRQLQEYENWSAQQRIKQRRQARRGAISTNLSDASKRAMLMSIAQESKTKEQIYAALDALNRTAPDTNDTFFALNGNKRKKNIAEMKAMVDNLTLSDLPRFGDAPPPIQFNSDFMGISSPERGTSYLGARYHRNGGPVPIPKSGKKPLTEEGKLKKSAHEDNLANANNILNEITTNSEMMRQSKGSIQMDGQRLWTAVEAGSTYGAYHNRNVMGQAQIEAFRDFQSNAQAKGYVSFDLETAGNIDFAAKDPNFFTTEYSAHNFHFDPTAKEFVEGEHFGRIAAPSAAQYDHYMKLIRDLRSNPDLIYTLDASTQRALFDFSKYSDIADTNLIPKSVKKYRSSNWGINSATGKADNVVHNNVFENLFVGKTTNPTEYLNEHVKYSAHIEKGLKNLRDKGYSAEAALADWNDFTSQQSDKYFFSHNGQSFDLNAIQLAAANIGQTAALPTKHIDFLQLSQTLFSDGVEMHSLLNPNRPAHFTDGVFTLNEFRRTFGWGTDLAHIGAYDTGEHGLGGAVNKTVDIFDQVLNATNKGGHKATNFYYDDTPIFKGQTFFAPAGVSNFQTKHMDFQAKITQDGVEMLTTDFNSNVLNKNTYYTVNGIRQRGKAEDKKFTLELYDSVNDTYVFINREGDSARHAFAEFINRNLINWDPENIDGTNMQSIMRERKLQDNARRRYSNLFGVQSGWTGGYEAARRIYDNIGKTMHLGKNDFDKFLEEGNWNSRVQYDKDGNPIADEKGNWVPGMNEQEAREVWAMRGRLIDEHQMVTEAIERIDSSIPGEGKFVTQQRGIALGRFMHYMDEEIGYNKNNRIDIDALEHEKRIIQYRDRTDGGREKSINLRNLDTASKDIINYMYKDLPEEAKDNAELKNNYANERLMSLVGSFVDTKDRTGKHLISKEAANAFVEHHYELGLNHSPVASATHLAHALSEVGFIREKINVENMEVRKGIDMENARMLIERSVQETSGISGITKISNNKAAVQILAQGAIGSKLKELDEANSVLRQITGGIGPNNARAVSSLIETVLNDSRYKGMHVALAMNAEGTVLDTYLYPTHKEETVINQLNRGQTPHGALKMTLPLTQKNGTMLINDSFVNTQSYYMYDAAEEKNRFMSSTEKISHAYQNVLRSYRTDEIAGQSVEKNIAHYMNSGKTGDAQGLINWLFRQETENASGVQRTFNLSDSMHIKNNISDLKKQAMVNFAPAMIRELVNDGVLRLEKGKNINTNQEYSSSFSDPKKSTHINKSGQRVLNNQITMAELTPDAQDIVRQLMPVWLEEELAGKIDDDKRMSLSGVKSGAAEMGNYSFLDARDMTPFAYTTAMLRDNQVQKHNAYSFNPEEQGKIRGAAENTYVNFDHMTITPVMKRIMDEGAISDGDTGERLLRDYRAQMHVKAVMMSDEDLAQRIMTMKETHLNLLLDEGIYKYDANNNLIADEARFPTLYEQQMLVSKGITKELYMDDVKKINMEKVDKGTIRLMWDTIKLDKKLSEERGKDVFRVLQGVHYGFDSTGKELIASKSDMLFSYTDDKRFLVGVQREQAHKLFLSLEKGTIGGGEWKGEIGYSQELINAILDSENTGLNDVGAIYSTNIKKHADFDSILVGKSNYIAEELNRINNPTMFSEAVEKIHGSGLGLNVETGKDGLIQLIDNSATGLKLSSGLSLSDAVRLDGLTKDDILDINNRMNSLTTDLREIGLNIPEEFQLPGVVDQDGNARTFTAGIQPLTVAQVPNWSNEEGRVNYGVRELDVFRRKGGDLIADYVMTRMLDGNAGVIREAQGLLDGIQAFAGNAPEGTPTIGYDKFAALPEYDASNPYAHTGTILDDSAVQKHINAGLPEGATPTPYRGFNMTLPTYMKNGQEIKFTVDNKPVDSIFVPFVEMKTTDGELHRKEIQGSIAAVWKASHDLDMKKAGGGTTNKQAQIDIAAQVLQNKLDSHVKSIKKHASSSKGHVFENVLKVQMPHSAQGVTKIVAPALTDPTKSDNLLHDTVFFNREQASNMGILEHLEKAEVNNEPYYVASSRYPTFHDGAINIVRAKINDNVGKNQQLITAGLATLLRADADGDYNHTVALLGNEDAGISHEALQENAKQVYMNQLEKRAKMLDINVSAADSDKIMDELAKGIATAGLDGMQKDRIMNFDIPSILDAIEATDGKIIQQANNAAEVIAKTSKALVGMASVQNSIMRGIALEHFKGTKAQDAIDTLGAGLEQKIISAKHGSKSTLDPNLFTTVNIKGQPTEYLKNPSLQFVQAYRSAMQYGRAEDWDNVLRIDKELLGSTFTNGHMLEEAVSHLRKLDMSKVNTAGLRMGLSSGMTGEARVMMDAMYGDDTTGAFMHSNTAATAAGMVQRGSLGDGFSEIQHGGSSSAPTIQTSSPYYGDTGGYGERKYYSSPGAPGPTVPQQPVNSQHSSYIDRGIEKSLDYLSDASNGKRGIMALGALGVLGGLALAKGTMGDSLMPENMPHNTGNHDNATPQVNHPGGQQAVHLQGGAQSPQGMAVRISGRAPGDMHNGNIGSLAGQAIAGSGIQTNINVRSQDDTSTINRDWLQSQFTTMVNEQ